MLAPLLALDPSQLAVRLESAARSRMVFRSLAAGRIPLEDPEVPVGLRRRLSGVTRTTEVEEVRRVRSRDGTTKLLLRLDQRDSIEAVLIPERNRTTLCVSTQVGCARGCRFCLTATMGLSRNLEIEEIVAQVHAGLRIVGEEGLPPLRNLVFMGMGEPLDNWASVQAALTILLHPRGFGFGPRHVTVSTVAPSPSAVKRLEDCPTRIAWSLHSADDRVRRALVATQRHPVEALKAAFVRLFQGRRDPLFVEMTLIEGVNDGIADAEAAVELLADFPTEVRFNLLPMNQTVQIRRPSRDDEGRAAGLAPSPTARVRAFEAVLREAGHFAMVRAPRGADERAACGQLAIFPEEAWAPAKEPS